RVQVMRSSSLLTWQIAECRQVIARLDLMSSAGVDLTDARYLSTLDLPLYLCHASSNPFWRGGRPVGIFRKCAATLVAAVAVLAATPATPVSAAVKFTAFPVPATGPSGITFGLDGNLWFTDVGGNIGRMTTAGATTLYELPSQAAGGSPFPVDLTHGPDGNLWFTEYLGGNIGRVTPSGAITEFPIPTGDWFSGIAPGWDGNLWFCESGETGPAIGRLTPDGTFSEFPISGTPIAITPGLDGQMWFTEIFGGKVGSISMKGKVREFDVPAPNPVLHGITTGPDGNIWFTDAGNADVWRLTITHRFGRLPNGQVILKAE